MSFVRPIRSTYDRLVSQSVFSRYRVCSLSCGWKESARKNTANSPSLQTDIGNRSSLRIEIVPKNKAFNRSSC